MVQYVPNSKITVFPDGREFSLMDNTRTYFLKNMPPMEYYLSLFTKRGNFDNTLNLICQYTKKLLLKPEIQNMICENEATAKTYSEEIAKNSAQDTAAAVKKRLDVACGVNL